MDGNFTRLIEFHRVTASCAHEARGETAIIGDDGVEDLVAIVERQGGPGLDMNGFRHEHVIEHHAIRRGAAAAVKVILHAKHVVVLRVHGRQVIGERGRGSLQVAQGAAAAVSGRRGEGSVRQIRYVLPLAITDGAILGAEPLIFFHGENRAQGAAHKAAVRVERGVAVGIGNGWIILEQQDGTVRKIPLLIRIDVLRDVVRPDRANLLILVVVENVELLEHALVIGGETNAIRTGARERWRLTYKNEPGRRQKKHTYGGLTE